MYKIEIKASDIKKGICGDPYACAVVLACKRAGFKFGPGQGVDGHSVEATDPYGFHTYKLLPKKVRRWISDFDTDRTSVKPITFSLR